MRTDTAFEALEPFFADGLIRELLYLVKTGKEAALYCCRGGWSVVDQFVAAKIYKPRSRRAFRNDSAYQDGRVIVNRRSARAVAKRTAFGREVQSSLWTGHEFETLRVLHAAGGRCAEALGRFGLGHPDGMDWRCRRRRGAAVARG